MDDKARKKLVRKLAVRAKFDKDYHSFSRRWCVDKLIRVFGDQGVADTDMEATVTTLLTTAKTLVRAKADLKIGIKLDKKRPASERASRRRRVEILYGLIATDPKLADAANADYLEFMARRRYRTIERLQLFVNPNGRGYFRYPDTCATNFSNAHFHWKVNIAAQGYWQPLNPPDDVPIWMTNSPAPPIAGFDPVAAINSLFTQESDPCQGNLLDCATTMNVVLMDSLLEALDPDAFTRKLATKTPIYLSIIHVNPTLDHPEVFFLTDNSAEGLFVKGGTALEDLQVGDHVYIRNHELYKTLRPTGSWNGEHALLTDGGNRRIDSDKGFKFMGHGMPHGGETGSIPRFYKGLLNEINTYLSRSFVLAKIFLNYLKSGKTQPPPGEVDHEAQSVTDPHGVTFTVDFYKFKVDFSYNDYDAKPPKGTKFAKKTEKDGFVVAHAPAQNQFMLHHRKEIADAISDGVTNRSAGVLFRLVTTADPGLDPNDPVWWVLVYVDADGVTELYYALFERKGAKKSLSMVPLEIGELYTEPLARVAGSTDVLTTRTRVSLDPAYIAFLKADKALPP